MFRHPHGPAGSRHISGKPHNLILEHHDSQHASFYWNKEVTLRFPKHLVTLLEAPTSPSQLSLDGTVVNSILKEDCVREGCILI